MPRIAALLPIFLVLSACANTARLGPTFVADDVPGEIDQVDGYEDGVDGLIVGDRLMAAGQYELALRAYYRAGAEDGLSIDVLTAIGSANMSLGRFGQAEAQLRRALELEPDFVPALNNLGALLIEKTEYGEARRLLELAFALDSGSSETIRDNLRLAIARMENQVYVEDNEQNRPRLIPRGGGVYTLTTPV